MTGTWDNRANTRERHVSFGAALQTFFFVGALVALYAEKAMGWW